ncbi:MAG: hypothetical protein KHZ50_18615 [Bacteroides ovatus]|nr:hypothetical protein [Bacteroides ovatus]
MTEKDLEKENVGGFFDMIKSALPTIGKVAMNVIGGLVNEENGATSGVYTVALGVSESGEGEGVHFLNKDGRVIAVNTSLTQSCSLNFPRKADNIGIAAELFPFSQLDVTDDLRDSAKSNAQRFGVTSVASEVQKGDVAGGFGIMSCLGYFTKKMLEIPFRLNSHITLQMIGKSLQITLSAGLQLKTGQALTLGTTGGGEQRRFNTVTAVTDGETNAKGSYILLPNALADYKDDDELELVGDLLFENVEGVALNIKRGQPLNYDVIQTLSKALS